MPGSGSKPGETPDLPVRQVIPELLQTLAADGQAILTAPPGSGKTTLVPLALADSLPGHAIGRIIVLEPRRVAARSAARFCARLRGQSVGQDVGYRVRFDTQVGDSTQVEFVTEGIFLRMLQANPELPGIAAVIFDEFHERSLNSDLSLALTLESRQALREDLKLLVMSATLESTRLARFLGASVICAEGRTWPVDTHFLPAKRDEPIARHAARGVRQIVKLNDVSSVLVFLPGKREIDDCVQMLTDLDADVLPLYGALSARAQDRALEDSGRQRVVVATNIAESSLTVAGVNTVVDSGLARQALFDAGAGLTRLETRRIANDSATQRCGRAGRQGPGHCLKLWDKGLRLAPAQTPEMLTADLSDLYLQLAAWGTDAGSLRWLDPPPAGALAAAAERLQTFAALDGDGNLTARGRRMARMGPQPRLAALIDSARGDIELATAAALVALLERPGPGPVDLRDRLDPSSQLARHWCQRLNVSVRADVNGADVNRAAKLIARAWPDRIALPRQGSRTRYQLTDGSEVRVEEPLAGSDYLAVADIFHGRVSLGAALNEKEFAAITGPRQELVEQLYFDSKSERVKAQAQTRLGHIVLAEHDLDRPDPEHIAARLCQAIIDADLAPLPWDGAAQNLQHRIELVRRHRPDLNLPDSSNPGLIDDADQWLVHHLHGKRGFSDLRNLDLASMLRQRLSWEQQQSLDQLAPPALTIPSGRTVDLDYTESPPVLAGKLQEFFGQEKTPSIVGGKIAVQLHLLSPAGRPMQITQDLAGFWKTTYFDVRRDMAGRYPKHPWPDDPLQATPTVKTKRAMQR